AVAGPWMAVASNVIVAVPPMTPSVRRFTDILLGTVEKTGNTSGNCSNVRMSDVCDVATPVTNQAAGSQVKTRKPDRYLPGTR
ncbi:MAG TPA: hypothetical protein VFQ19_16170, partial [Nocardioidaceae bacterium]|nr:hypothetical protein [Nocardioidaceae bacterium]